MQITIDIDDNLVTALKNQGISIKKAINDFLNRLKNEKIEYVSDEEQKEIEKMLNSMSEEDKKIAFSKTIEIEI